MGLLSCGVALARRYRTARLARSTHKASEADVVRVMLATVRAADGERVAVRVLRRVSRAQTGDAVVIT